LLPLLIAKWRLELLLFAAKEHFDLLALHFWICRSFLMDVTNARCSVWIPLLWRVFDVGARWRTIAIGSLPGTASTFVGGGRKSAYVKLTTERRPVSGGRTN
jgi:hypothetical protein